MSQNLCAGVAELHSLTKMKFRFLLSLKSSRIFSTGVVRSLIWTKSVKNGLLVRVPSPWINRNMVLGFELLPTILGKLVFMKFSGMGDGFGCTQSRKSTLVKDIVGYVHETSREQPSLVELPDQSHSGVTDVDNH